MYRHFPKLIIALILIPLRVNAQADRIKAYQDSLRLTTNDSIRWHHKLWLADATFKADTAKGKIAFQHLKESDEYKSSQWKQFFYHRIWGGHYFEIGDYVNQILELEIQESLLNSLPSKRQRNVLSALIKGDFGATYANINEPELAQKYYEESISIQKEINDEKGLATNYFNSAFLFIDVQEWPQAYQYLRECDVISRKTNIGWMTIINRSRLAAVCAKLNKISEAKILLNETGKLLPKAVYDLEKVYFYNAKGELEFELKNFKQALKYHQKAFELANAWADPYYIADELIALGDSYQKLNQQDSTLKCYQEALKISERKEYMPKVRLVLKNMAEFYEQTGNYKMANEYRKKWAIFNEKFIKKQNQNRIQLNEARFRSAQKQEKINTLEQENQIRELQLEQKNYILIALIISVLVLSLLAFLYFKNYKKEKLLAEQNNEIQQQKIRELEQEKQLISMNSILKGQEEERSRMAKDLHDGLGSMLSGIKLNLSAMHQNFVIHSSEVFSFEKALTQLDSAIAEMRRVAHNMMPEALLKFGLHEAIQDYCDGINQNGTLKMQFTAIGDGKNLDATMQKVLYRIFQELTNNAIKHAQAKTIFIQIGHHEQGITLTVEDDGKGFDTSKTNGAGLSNVKSRVDYLKGTLHIDTSPKNGTSIIVEIPNG
ncbi:hypothetical protein GCM10011514_03140 [Emticicia aquatilis]|uniref:histidine kinase n=1 Tax=Emticicia aquatilis TaxID=1537369 RepID=A0A916YFI2_9BACT|nr:ATP-binding protein [Emticicia aquatilis]GGD42535.1 hypothetical protein GCM10011514_03140 [Emticicia aquatilis]